MCLILTTLNNCIVTVYPSCKPPILPTLVLGILFLHVAACRQSRKRIRRQLGACGLLSQAMIGHWPGVCVPGYLPPRPWGSKVEAGDLCHRGIFSCTPAALSLVSDMRPP
jgi:hypothetical protein